MRRVISIFLLSLTLLVIQGCDSKETKGYETIADRAIANQKAYVDFEKFKEGRPCAEVRFMCLPESQDKAWQSIPTQDKIEDLNITPEVEKQYALAIKASNKQYHAYMKIHPKATRKEIMLISSLDRDFFEKVDARRFLEEMEQDLEKEFPGFWREVAKPVRYRWIRRAMNKAKKLGYEKATSGIIQLCARIGLDFDLDPKWKNITEFITLPKANLRGYDVAARNYIDFTIFNKDYTASGHKFTDWYLKESLSYLPKPERDIPKLHP